VGWGVARKDNARARERGYGGKRYLHKRGAFHDREGRNDMINNNNERRRGKEMAQRKRSDLGPKKGTDY